MSEPLPRNRCEPWELSDAEVREGIARLSDRDGGLASEAGEVWESLTWGEGPGLLRQALLQDWLWYVLPTKYFADEHGCMGRLAEAAAALFDEVGLFRYAQLCRSEATAVVHAGFERSDAVGRTALRKAMRASGIEPPDLDGFCWGGVMGSAEALARSVVEDALEAAIVEGVLVPGARGWRQAQARIASSALDGNHPVEPGQSWRTVVVTERLQRWVDGAERRSPMLAGLRGRVANRLLHPVGPPVDVAEMMSAVVWFLDTFGGEQALTQAGYLRPALVQQFQAEAPWDDPFARDRPPHSELDAVMVLQLREWLQASGALRRHQQTKRKQALRRTKVGSAVAADPVRAWGLLVENVAEGPWEQFVVETAALVLIDRGVEMPRDELFEVVATLAGEMGWPTSGGAVGGSVPTDREVSHAFHGSLTILELCGVFPANNDWTNRQLVLTPAGEVTMLAMIRESAAGPRSDVW